MYSEKCSHCGGSLFKDEDGLICLSCSRRSVLQPSSHLTRSFGEWVGTHQVAKYTGEKERVIRYRLEAGILPGVKHEGKWHVPPAVVGDDTPSIFKVGKFGYQVLSVGPIPEEEVSVSTLYPGMARIAFYPAKGSSNRRASFTTLSGEVSTIAHQDCSGPVGYISVVSPSEW